MIAWVALTGCLALIYFGLRGWAPAEVQQEIPKDDEPGIRPCPFCNGTDKLSVRGSQWLRIRWVYCLGCKTSGPHSDRAVAPHLSDRSAILLWNAARRPTDD